MRLWAHSTAYGLSTHAADVNLGRRGFGKKTQKLLNTMVHLLLGPGPFLARGRATVSARFPEDRM